MYVIQAHLVTVKVSATIRGASSPATSKSTTLTTFMRITYLVYSGRSFLYLHLGR
jgi:hypothetical protein